MKKKIIRNALTVSTVALIELLQRNMVNNLDGTQTPSYDCIFQARALCQIGLGKEVEYCKFKFEFEKVNKNILSLLGQSIKYYEEIGEYNG